MDLRTGTTKFVLETVGYVGWTQWAPNANQNWTSSEFVALHEVGGRSTHVYDPEDGHLVGKVTASERTARYLVVHGWVRPDQLLFSMSGYLVAWNPTSSELAKIATLPASDIGGAHGSVGIRFPPFSSR